MKVKGEDTPESEDSQEEIEEDDDESFEPVEYAGAHISARLHDVVEEQQDEDPDPIQNVPP